jgi:hypothetical protein
LIGEREAEATGGKGLGKGAGLPPSFSPAAGITVWWRLVTYSDGMDRKLI